MAVMETTVICWHIFPRWGPSPMNNYQQNIPVLGTSPDARRRAMQVPHGNGFGFSPAGNFAPMSLGTSPSQFTPPYSQVTAGSPGHYGPSSPARGSCHGSPLGKGTGSMGNQMNRRKGWGYSGTLPPQESTASAHRMQQQRNSGNGGANSSFGSGKPLLPPKHDKPEASSSLPDPGDWDPNYSDDLLLEDNSSELNSMTLEFSKSMQVSQAFSPTGPFGGVGQFNQTSNSNLSTQRPNVPIQAFPNAETSPDVYVHPMMMNSSHLIPHFSPSRLGQPPVQRYGRSMGSTRGGEWNHFKAPLPNFNSGGPRSPGSNNSAPWGRRGNHPIAANILPSSHGRNEYERIV
ncbi:dual specificity protein kinase YAK1 homolog [Bidens hawaiensis]|uniref:dual specificity protein kinase YAK1 homolog n=1 Tax=Bidens hawaiensis TaxID=980011 RepID=UPI004048F269